MKYQRGGSIGVYLIWLVLAVCAAEALLINNLYHHRTIEIRAPVMCPTKSVPNTTAPGTDDFITHAFHRWSQVCDGFTICYIKI